jgi:hypothetical protein
LKTILLGLILFFPSVLFSQVPLYYQLKKVQGDILLPDGTKVNVEFITRRRLKITGCTQPDVDTFLRTLTLNRISRKYLQHLITTSAEITLDINDKIGIMRGEDGKYRLVAALTGVEEWQSDSLITDWGSNLTPRNKRKKPSEVHEQNTVQIFRRSLKYAHNTSYPFTAKDVYLYDWATNKQIGSFSLDTIKLEPLENNHLLPANTREFYTLIGTHEIVHTTPRNIDLALQELDNEEEPYAVEAKLYKKLKRINRRKIRFE